MTLFEFLLKLGFWQWIGVLMLSGIVFGCTATAVAAIMNVRLFSFTNNKITKKEEK